MNFFADDADYRRTASHCLVEFCRNECSMLPDGAEVWRATGTVACEVCGVELRKHKHFAYPTGMSHVVQGCDGRYYHL